MKNIVVIIVYNRYENLARWLSCWEQCDKKECELRVIHNCDNDEERKRYRNICNEHKVTYISRANVGMDIGAFQDVCKEKLSGFDNNWNNMLWFTDDCIPMSKDFVNTYLRNMTDPKIGVACMEISNEVKKHIRTTGFCIKKEISKKLVFAVETIKTKTDCYSFEHRHPALTFLQQVLKMGYNAVQIAPLKNSVVWDTGNRAHLNRMKEFESVFSYKEKEKKVLFISLIYNSYPYVISSLQMQTHKNWELLLIHDGKNETGLSKEIEKINDNRIIYVETKERKGNWGHFWRNWALEQVKLGIYGKDCDYVVITNADNQHVPGYTEFLLKGFTDSAIVATFCNQMIHNYINWEIIPCKMERGYIDSACVMVKKDVATNIGWKDVISHSSDWTYFSDIIRIYGINSFKKVSGCLLVHN